MDKLPYLLVFLSIIISNIYIADSYALNANYLTNFGFIQTIGITISDDSIDSVDPNVFDGFTILQDLIITSKSLLTIDLEVFKGTVNLRSLKLNVQSFTNSKNIKLPSLTYLSLATNLTSLNKAMISAFPSLTRFSTSYYDDSSHRFVSSRNIKTIDVHTFEDLSNLEDLSLEYSSLTSFEYLQIPKNLKGLHLNYNNMNYFALSRTMGVLECLEISNNRFRSFKSMDFTFLANLTRLSLYDNPHAYPNEISGHLKPLVKLMEVYLRNLSINTIDSNFFKTNTKLHNIDLSINKISSLDSRSFIGLNDLQGIVLNTNYLSTIEPGTFANLPSLKNVDLSFNQLTHLDSSIFAGSNNLLTITLSGNSNLSTANLQSLCPPAATYCQVIN